MLPLRLLFMSPLHALRVMMRNQRARPLIFTVVLGVAFARSFTIYRETCQRTQHAYEFYGSDVCSNHNTRLATRTYSDDACSRASRDMDLIPVWEAVRNFIPTDVCKLFHTQSCGEILFSSASQDFWTTLLICAFILGVLWIFSNHYRAARGVDPVQVLMLNAAERVNNVRDRVRGERRQIAIEMPPPRDEED